MIERTLHIINDRKQGLDQLLGCTGTLVQALLRGATTVVLPIGLQARVTAHGVGGLGLGCRLGILGSGKLLAELGKLCLDLLVLELEVVVSSLLASANSGFDHLFLGHLSRFLGHIGLLLLNNQFGGLRCLIGRLHGILHGYLHVRLLTT